MDFDMCIKLMKNNIYIQEYQYRKLYNNFYPLLEIPGMLNMLYCKSTYIMLMPRPNNSQEYCIYSNLLSKDQNMQNTMHDNLTKIIIIFKWKIMFINLYSKFLHNLVMNHLSMYLTRDLQYSQNNIHCYLIIYNTMEKFCITFI